MNLSKSIVSILAVLTVTALSASAFAQLRANPVYGQRNLTNAKNTVEIIAGPLGNYGGGGLGIASFTPPSVTVGSVTVTGDAITTISLAVGAAYGVNNDLSIGAMAVPLRLDPEFAYLNPTLFGKYRFLHGSFEAAGALGLTIPVQEGSDFGMSIGVPMRNRGALRLDIAPTVNLTFADSLVTNVAVPIQAFYNVMPSLFVGVVTGVNFTNEFGTIGVPVGLGGGYTLQAAEGPMLDINATFVVPGLTIADDTNFTADSWTATIGASYHLYL